jgi:orotate phosphoribosyltransferase
MESSLIGLVGAVSLILIVIIIAASDVLDAFYLYLSWPKWLVRRMDRRRAEEVKNVIQELGIDRQLLRDSVQAARINQRAKSLNRYSRPEDVRIRALRLLSSVRLQGEFRIGRRFPKSFPDYIDAFTGAMDRAWAEEAVSVMLSHLRIATGGNLPPFSKIVGIKNGTPVLAWLAADRLRLRCVLHRGEDLKKPWGTAEHPTGCFDGELVPGDIVLLVDDSTTGGRLAMEAVEQIRQLGAIVEHFLVLFERVGKDARGLLQDQGIMLYPVISLDEKTMTEISRLQYETESS